MIIFSDFSLVAESESKSTIKMNTVSSSGGDILKADAPPFNMSASGRAKNGSETSVATSTSSVSINLEGTSILTTAYSRGYMAHNYVGVIK